MTELYPHGWVEEGSGAPIRTVLQPLGTRHVPQGSPWGGYDPCGLVRTGHDSAEWGRQDLLF